MQSALIQWIITTNIVYIHLNVKPIHEFGAKKEPDRKRAAGLIRKNRSIDETYLTIITVCTY